MGSISPEDDGLIAIDDVYCMQKYSQSMEDSENLELGYLKISADLFRDNSLSAGGIVKEAGEVLKTLEMNTRRTVNVNCRVEAFGRIAESCVGMKRKWVLEMGFGGLMNLAFKQLPRILCYWLMAMVDPFCETLNTPDGRKYKFCKNQVSWILGVRSGSKEVPKKPTEPMKAKIKWLFEKYGRDREGKNAVNYKHISVGTEMTSRLEGQFDESEETEFKTMFLIAALNMVLCPNQSITLATDLIPAATCACEADQYDWAKLVLEKLMESVKAFAKRFYSDGFAGGCGGCSIFLAVLYLDRLNRCPVFWGDGPRIKYWTTFEMKKACREDRFLNGDFGKLGCLDVAYGEAHPLEARDKEAGEWIWNDEVADVRPDVSQRSRKRRVVVADKFICVRKKRKKQREEERQRSVSEVADDSVKNP